jgi:hypothetical protein
MGFGPDTLHQRHYISGLLRVSIQEAEELNQHAVVHICEFIRSLILPPLNAQTALGPKCLGRPDVSLWYAGSRRKPTLVSLAYDFSLFGIRYIFRMAVHLYANSNLL